MILPRAPLQYDPNSEEERNRILAAADQDNFKRSQDVRMKGESNPNVFGTRLILRAPDGGLWQVVVSNAGALSTVSIPV